MDDNKFHGLNHLRSLAVILVFLFHYQLGIYSHPEWVTTIGSFGWTGVDLFFVLSGFLIASGLFSHVRAHNRIDFKTYFIKRSFRILPAYWAVLAIYCCFPFFMKGKPCCRCGDTLL